ncbi:PREDICTED: glycolipid transfer protein-like [Cyprinodon variegatus]|uniref:glycolipid transfer protein-like n=1 Tax=Cyprinodon variegatus TaxID=28743 RepID=UPI000742BCBE|nr:PREDICTED: glycolipid transfer protein-like [Cyprinodon variegatus]
MSLLLDNQFKELPADKSVDTKTFLDNVSSLPSFFDCFGSSVFSIIKKDLNGNITKIKAVYVQDPAKYATLQNILEAEREAHKEWPKVGATLALMWLKRMTLPLFLSVLQAALYASPYRSDFLKALSKGEEVKEEDCMANLRTFLVNYTATVDAIYEMYTNLNAELDYTV